MRRVEDRTMHADSYRIDRRGFFQSTGGTVALAALAASSASTLGSQQDEQAPQEETGDKLPETQLPEPHLYATGFAPASGLALDRQDNLFVSNYRDLGAIGLISKDGTARIFCNLRELSPAEGVLPLPRGMKIDSEGRLIVADAGAGRLLRLANDGSNVEVLADRCDGARLERLQDVALDIVGNIFFTDTGDAEHELAEGHELARGSVYRYSINTRKVAKLDGELSWPSGVGVTPDQTRICVAERGARRIVVHDLSAEGTLSNRRVLALPPVLSEKPGQAEQVVTDGLQPNGFVFDTSGRMYVVTASGHVHVIDVGSGELLRQYNAGGQESTSCHFRGDYLYTAVASKEAVFRLELGVDGFGYNGLA